MDFEGLLRLLSDRGIKFIVVGGVACALNGFVRATEDVDILIETSEANITSMLNTLREWGEGFARELDLSDFSTSPGAVRLIEDFPLDIFTMLDEKTYEELLPQTKVTEQGIVYLNHVALIDIKKKSMREKDRIDALALKKLSNT
jgi:predicted nucleotidyltransferase